MRLGIVAFSGMYPINIGGPGNVAYFLAREFGKLGHEITLFVRGKDQEEMLAFERMKEFSDLKSVSVIPIEIDYRFRTLANPLLLSSKVIEASLKLHERDFDIILYNSPPIDIAAFFPTVCRLKGIKQTIIFHGLFHSHGLLYNNIPGRLLIRFQRRHFNAAFTPGDFPEDAPLPCGFERGQVTVIPNGIPLEEIETSSPADLDGYPRILHTGVLTKRKRVDTLIKATSRIIGNHPDIRLYLVGDGPERERLERLSQSLDVEDHVVFVGFLKDTRDVFRYYKSCQAFVMPSHKEAFGITLAEAMACGVPVIASDIHGAPRMLLKHGENGFLFPVGDWKTLSEQLLELLEKEDLRTRFVKRNLHLVREHLTWETIALKYMTVFNDLLNGNRESSGDLPREFNPVGHP